MNITHQDPDSFPLHPTSREGVVPLVEASEPVVVDPYNERVKLYGVRPLEIATASPPEIAEDFASKITAYAPPGDEKAWRKIGFEKEAVIRGFFESEDAHLWAAYNDEQRSDCSREAEHQATVELALTKPIIEAPPLAEGYTSEIATVSDSPQIASLLDQTFEDYPTPIEETIIAQQIHDAENVFRVVRNPEGTIAAVASAELDHLRGSAEMTDCATRPNDRGRGLMAHILRSLESDISDRFGIEDLYTIARADEVGMNCVFRKLGYDYSGRLINNCRMPNGWESMNVWCRNSRVMTQ